MKLIKQLNTITLIFSLGLMLFFCSCKKYPEDGKFSIHSVKDRLENNWELKECLVDGNDLISMVNNYRYTVYETQKLDSVIYSLVGFNIKFRCYKTKENMKIHDAIYIVRDIRYGNQLYGGVEWELKENKNKIKFKNAFIFPLSYGANSLYIHLLYNPSNEAWEIKKLTNLELRLETINSSNQKVKLKFNRL